jgi:hypothetical protein
MLQEQKNRKINCKTPKICNFFSSPSKAITEFISLAAFRQSYGKFIYYEMFLLEEANQFMFYVFL